MTDRFPERMPLAIYGSEGAGRAARATTDLASRTGSDLYLAIALALLMALGTLRGVAGLFSDEVSTAAVVNVVLFLMSAGYLSVAAKDIFATRRSSSEST